MVRRRLVLVRTMPAVAAALLSLVAVARAEEAATVSSTHASADAGITPLVEQGLTLYRARDYRRAAEKFVQAYAIDQDPNLLFNIARCYESLGDSAGAMEKYEAYLRSPNIDAVGKERADGALRALREARNAKSSSNNRAAEKTKPSTPPAAAHADSKVAVGWIVTGALAAGTVVTGVLAAISANQLREARDEYPGNSANVDGLSSKTFALSVSSDALGVATVLMGGLSLYWTLTSSSSQAENKVGVSPSVLPIAEVRAGLGPSGLQMMGTF